MKTIYEAKELIKNNYKKIVTVKVLGMRNKREYLKGEITEIYKNIFIIQNENQKRSFSYTDLLIGNIQIKKNN